MKKVIKYILLFILLMNICILSSCKKKYTVSFYDYDNSLIKEVKVKEGEEVVPPNDRIREGYVFIGWDVDLGNISKDTVVYAKYKEITKTLIYELSSDKSYYIVTGIDYNDEKDIIIPSEYQGLPVKEIGNRAFYHVSMTTIELPDSIVKIGNKAFEQCFKLTDIKFSNGIKEIGDLAFYNCISINNIKLPNSLIKLGKRAFFWCQSLETVELSNNLIEIPTFCFANCYNLLNINIPDSVNTIKSAAFEYCSQLKNIKLSKNIRTIETYAFQYCSSLTIYCELSQAPENWSANWNPLNRPVVWGYKE